MGAFGPPEWILCAVAAILASGQLAFAYSHYKRSASEQPIARTLLETIHLHSLVVLAVSAGLSALLFFLASTAYGYSFIDCCYEGTLLDTAIDLRFLDTVLTPIATNLLLLVSVFFAIGLVGFGIGRLGKGAVVLAGAALWLAIFGYTASWFGARTNSLSEVVEEASGVPLYSGSHNVWIDKTSFSWYNWHDITFDAPAEQAVLMSFYRQVLPTHGWVIEPQYSSDYALVFLRVDSHAEPGASSEVAWKYDLSIIPSATADVVSSPQTTLTLTASRYPDLERLPVYPHARHVQQSRETNGSAGAASGSGNEQTATEVSSENAPVKTYTVTFTAPASPEDVLEWYRSTLLSYQWWHEESPDSNTAQGTGTEGKSAVHFVFLQTQAGPRTPNTRSVDLYVRATPASGGGSDVEVQAISQNLK